ncbi:MAG: YhfC family glutamic-type intramembrane protease [Actinomycetota bacterium]
MGLFDLASILAIIIEIGLPLALAVFVWKRYKVSWALFLLAMALFLVSLVRIPLNNWVSSAIRPDLGAESYVIFTALFASFTAALFEEGARVIGLGYIVRAKSFHKGLMYGIGHGGGGEAMVLIGFTGLANYIVFRFMPHLVPQAEEIFSGIAWYMPLVGAMERVFAIAVQIFLSILIIQAFIQKRYYYIAIAFIFHLLLDFAAVYLNYRFSLLVAEIAIFVFAAAAAIFIIFMQPKKADRLKQPEK